MNLAASVWEIIMGVVILAAVLGVMILIFWLASFIER